MAIIKSFKMSSNQKFILSKICNQPKVSLAVLTCVASCGFTAAMALSTGHLHSALPMISWHRMRVMLPKRPWPDSRSLYVIKCSSHCTYKVFALSKITHYNYKEQRLLMPLVIISKHMPN